MNKSKESIQTVEFFETFSVERKIHILITEIEALRFVNKQLEALDMPDFSYAWAKAINVELTNCYKRELDYLV